MSRILSVASAIDKNKITSSTAWVALLEIQIVDPNTRDVTETLYVARNDESLLFGGQDYQAANFEFQIDQKQGQTPNVTLAAQDQTGYIQSRMEAMAGGIFSNIILRVVNTARLDQPPEMEHTFQVTEANVANYVVNFTLGSENALNIMFPKHRQWRERCAWRFKGYGCGYTGNLTTCDYTLEGANGCQVHFPGSYSLPFRGVPGLVSMNI